MRDSVSLLKGSSNGGSPDWHVPLLLELDHEIQRRYGQPPSFKLSQRGKTTQAVAS